MSDSNLVAFGEFSPEAAEDARQEIDDEGNEFWKPKEGWNTVRILPPPAGRKTPFRKVFTHYLPNPKKKGNIPVVCPRLTKVRNKDTDELKRQNSNCAICEASADLRASGNQLDKDRGYELRAQPRTFCSIIVRGDKGNTIRVFGCSKTVYDALVEFREDPDEPCDYTHPLEGYDIRVHRTGTSMNDTEYKTRLAKRPSPLMQDDDGADDIAEMNKLITGQYNLDTYATLPNDEDIQAALNGESPTQSRRLTSGSSDKEESTSRRSRRRASSDAGEEDGEIVEGDDDMPNGM